MKPYHSFRFILLLLATCLFVLSACASEPSVPTAAPPLPASTASPTPRSTATPSPTPLSTATPSPTLGLTPLPGNAESAVLLYDGDSAELERQAEEDVLDYNVEVDVIREEDVITLLIQGSMGDEESYDVVLRLREVPDAPLPLLLSLAQTTASFDGEGMVYSDLSPYTTGRVEIFAWDTSGVISGRIVNEGSRYFPQPVFWYDFSAE